VNSISSILVRVVGLALIILCIHQLTGWRRGFDSEFESGRRILLGLLALLGLYLLVVGDIRGLLPW
jgi:hypothetical protein